jgi:threonine dehydrogenase-like Zn-dependent dehydrogenase
MKCVATNICGSDQHMVRGRTTAPEGLILGHEITGEVIETGRDVEFIKEGDLCSVPFNIACGRCRMCKTGNTGACLNVNPDRPGSAYGYVDMGGWVGGQAEYALVPYADWNLLPFPDKDLAMEKILDLTMLSDIFPTGSRRRGASAARRSTCPREIRGSKSSRSWACPRSMPESTPSGSRLAGTEPTPVRRRPQRCSIR